MDVQREIMAEMGQKPDLIIGNYSDGNLVASLLAHRMFVTQCTIAHALEKTKYQDADIKWCVELLLTWWKPGVPVCGVCYILIEFAGHPISTRDWHVLCG